MVAALALFAAGDITLMTTMGARFGYGAPMWLVLVALAGLFAFQTVTARYHLATGESISWALTRPAGGAWIRYYMIFGVTLATHLYNSYIIKGFGISWHFMFPAISAKVWSIIWIVIGLVILFRNAYDWLETIFKWILAAMSLAILYLFIAVTPNIGGLLSSFIPKPMPGGSTTEMFSLALSVMGATTTSVVIVAYAYLVYEKGWRDMSHNKMMNWDAFVGVALTLVFNTMLFVVAAEVLNPQGVQVKNVDEMAKVLGTTLGAPGFWLFYVGLFAAVYSSWIGFGYTQAVVARDALDPILGKPESEFKDKVFNGFLYFNLLLPLIWTFTDIGFVSMVLFATSVLNFFFLIPLVLVMVQSNVPKFEPRPGTFQVYRAAWWENLFLGVILATVLYFCVQTVIKLLS